MSIRICAVLPLTLDRIGPVEVPETEEPTKVGSLQEAFDLFRPLIDLQIRFDEFGEEFRFRYPLRSLEDFSPQKMCAAGEPGGGFDGNDLTALQGKITFLERLRTIWETEGLTGDSALVAAIRSAVAAEQSKFNAARAVNRLKRRVAHFRCVKAFFRLVEAAEGFVSNRENHSLTLAN